MKNFFKNILCKNKYRYVIPCPRCGSHRTGYVINDVGIINFDVEKEKDIKLLNGEIVEVHSYIDDENTLFCLDCGINWPGVPEIRYLTDEELEKEKIVRGIDYDFVSKRILSKKYLKKAKKMFYNKYDKDTKDKEIENDNISIKVKTENVDNKNQNKKEIVLDKGPNFKSIKFNNFN